jgi:ABC-type multidrug transport system fused ATPase/permease subunit
MQIMKSPVTTGRTIGALLLAHLATGLMTPYVMLRPLNEPLAFDANDARNAFQVRLSVMLLFIGGAVSIAIAVTAWPIVREYSSALGVWLIALAIANFSLQCVENAAWMSMFTLSQQHATASAADAPVYNIVGASVRSYWKWVHYTHLLVMVSWMFLLFVTLWRAALVPRVLAGLGLLTTLMQITGITLPQFIPYPTPPMIVMGVPLAFVYVATSVWLMSKGFRPRQKLAADERGLHE